VGASRPREIELGHIVGAFGVRGEVKLFLHHRDGELWDRPRPVTLVAPDGGRREAVVTIRPGAGKRILGRIDGLTDRDLAAAMAGTRLVVDPASLPAAGPGEFYVWQLQGAAVHVEGDVVGEIRTVQHTEGMDVLVVDVGDGEPVFVPCVSEWVADIDAVAGVVTLVPGALDEDPS